MNVNNKHYRTIWLKNKKDSIVQIIDQRFLPHEFIIEDLRTVNDVVIAIKDMHVRGAGLIGAAAGYGIYLATREALKSKDFNGYLHEAANQLNDSRPTAVNLSWAVKKQLDAIRSMNSVNEKIEIALRTAKEIADFDADCCRSIGEYGLGLLKKISKLKKGKTVNILTHCNAGWLAFVDFGTALSPVYHAFDEGLDVHVWVDETRPRNQGASLTAWELVQHGVPHTIIADNVGGHLMQHGMVDIVIVGSDRTTYTGDVANKVGTYLKALAAYDNKIPFYAALPSSTIDWEMVDGIREIPIEERSGDEVKYIEGLNKGKIRRILLAPENSKATNFAFDVTPARLVTGLITEKGICNADKDSILGLFPEKR
jgi:methylthioribose-1-phosphate isomerase